MIAVRVSPLLVPIVLALLSGLATAQTEEAERVVVSSRIVDELMAASDASIPTAVLDGADAIAVFPSTFRGGFIFGGHRGRGLITARDPETGGWSAPAFLTLTGGSFGLQIGGQSVDVVLVVMNRRGLEKLLQSEFKVGGDASAVVGPVGRDVAASTDILLQAEILSYSRTRGLFAGLRLEGSTITSDDDANERFYGTRLTSQQIVLDGQGRTPAHEDAVRDLHEALERHVPGE